MIEIVDREEELRRFKALFTAMPNAIYFVYGPKSCGKTTIVQEAIYQSIKEGAPASFYYYDLRRYFIPDYRAVLEVLFETERESRKVVRKGSWEMDLKVFKIKKEELEEIARKQRNPFEAMEKRLIEEKATPNIIIDELQKLRWIYMNGERQFVDELLNFFVTVTKVSHLANVFIITSDTFLIEELYGNSKLTDVAKHIKIGWVPEEAVRKYLKRQGFSEEEVNLVMEKIGGRIWAVEQIKTEKEKGIPVVTSVEELYKNSLGVLKEALDGKPEEGITTDKLKKLLKQFKDRDKFELKEGEQEQKKLIRFLVDKEILFFDPVERTVEPHSKTMLLAIREVIG